MDLTQLLQWLAPFVVYLATFVIKRYKPLLPGWVIVSVVVPLLSAIAAVIVVWANPQSMFFVQLIGGFLAVFINELVRQLQQIKNGK